jgi:hypothetical protein
MSKKKSNTFTTIIKNIKDDNNDNIDLKIIFNEIDDEFHQRKIKAFDTKGRYFYAEYAAYNMDHCQEFEYYKNKVLNKELNIIFNNFEGRLTIFLDGGGFRDSFGLDEEIDSPLNLLTINKKIIKAKDQLKELEEQKTKSELFFVF